MREPAPAEAVAAPVPEPGTSGRLRMRLRELVLVRILQRLDDQLLLVPVETNKAPSPELDTASPPELDSGPVLFEARCARGLVRLRGTAERLESGVIRFRLVGLPEVLQRRRFVRVRAPQRVRLESGFGDRLDTWSVNLSGGGMLVTGADQLEMGARFRFEVELQPERPSIVGWGRVVRADESGNRAIEFEEISRDERERLIHFLFDRQRAVLQMTRDHEL
jgi:PilZ domain